MQRQEKRRESRLGVRGGGRGEEKCIRRLWCGRVTIFEGKGQSCMDHRSVVERVSLRILEQTLDLEKGVETQRAPTALGGNRDDRAAVLLKVGMELHGIYLSNIN